MKFSRAYKKKKTLQLTSVIDIVFLLLIFFMISTKFHDVTTINLAVEAKQEINPESDDNLIDMKKEQIEIDLIDAQRVTIQGKEFDISNIGQVIKQVVVFDPDKKIVIKIMPEHNVQNLIYVIDQINSAGAENISILKRVED